MNDDTTDAQWHQLETEQERQEYEEWSKAYDKETEEQRMVDRSGSFKGEGGQWLKAEDIQSHSVKVVIAKVTDETMDDFKTQQPVQKVCLKFDGKDKGLVLNKTNGDKLITQYGADDSGWIGKEVGLEYHYYDDFGRAGIVLTILDKEFNDDIPF